LPCQEKYEEQQLSSVAKKYELGIQFGWSPSFMHVDVLSQSGYHGFTTTPARDTGGDRVSDRCFNNIVSYVCSPSTIKNKTTILMLFLPGGVGGDEGGDVGAPGGGSGAGIAVVGIEVGLEVTGRGVGFDVIGFDVGLEVTGGGGPTPH
jgi:hypothetical protein